MPVSEICNREVVIVRRSNTILEAAQLMRQHHVGDVVVVEDRGSVRVPVGILTLDDLLELLAEELLALAKLVRHEQKKETLSRR